MHLPDVPDEFGERCRLRIPTSQQHRPCRRERPAHCQDGEQHGSNTDRPQEEHLWSPSGAHIAISASVPIRSAAITRYSKAIENMGFTCGSYGAGLEHPLLHLLPR